MSGWEDWPSRARICSGSGSRAEGSAARPVDTSFKWGPDSEFASSSAKGSGADAEREAAFPTEAGRVADHDLDAAAADVDAERGRGLEHDACPHRGEDEPSFLDAVDDGGVPRAERKGCRPACPCPGLSPR